MNGPARILFVDDEPQILEGLQRQLRWKFPIVTAVGAKRGLELLAARPDLSVIVSDMRMPEMSGAEFLGQARRLAPDAVQMLLTGQADLESTITAVNKGNLFRFLCKPCPSEELVPALEAALKQHDLLRSDKDMLEKTLRGAVRALVQVLALASPGVFGRAERLRRLAAASAAKLGMPDAAEIEMAALVSQLGAVTLPPEVIDALERGEPLDPRGAAMVARIPALSAGLIAHIPRLESVAEMVRRHRESFDTAATPPSAGARLLGAVVDFDALQNAGFSPVNAARELCLAHPEEVVHALASCAARDAEGRGTRPLPMKELREGMLLEQDVHTVAGMLLVRRGQEVNAGLLERLQNFAMLHGIAEPLLVSGGPPSR